SFTLLGDVAQATGPHEYHGWDELLPHLPGGARAELSELRHAYRVPREIMELALPLLGRIAPEIEPPLSYRTGAAAPRIVAAEPALPCALEEAAALADGEGLLAVVVPESLRARDDEPVSLFDETRIPVLTPHEAKGLEFDHV